MGKYKVVVYAIAKNEAKFAEKWAKNMSEADEIYVLLDPTSTDNTKQILEENGVIVKEKLIRPWRFDTARNESLKLVPKDADICVCTDLDEVFTPGWRKVLEEKWTSETNQAVYQHYFNAHQPDQIPNIFNDTKIHDRKNFRWKWLIHEHLVSDNRNIQTVFLDGIILYHYPDMKKPRSYKELLERAVKEEPKDTRYVGLLIEEYFNANEYDKAIKYVYHLLAMPNLLPNDIGIAYKYLIKIKVNQEKQDEVKNLSYEALSKCDNCRIFYGELGRVLVLHYNEYEIGIAMLKKCMEIKDDVVIARESDWKDYPYINNLISIGYYYLKDYDKAIEYVSLAIEKNPDDTYVKNKELYIKVKEENK